MKDFFRHNGILLLVIALLLAAITAITGLVLGGTAGPVQSVVGTVTTPVRNGVNSFIDWVEGRYDYAFRYDALTEQNGQLMKKVAEMEQQVRDAETALAENDRLHHLLGLAERRRDFVFESATVTARSTSNWASTLTISKGENGGVAVQDCVVDEYGNLVGVVTTVGPNWATVTTLIDTDTNMGGLVGRTDTAAILEGDFALMGAGQLKLTYLPERSELIAGDEVLTSGMGGVYPSGLVVGVVEEVHTDPSGISRYAVVTPKVELEKLSQIFVIKAFDVVE